MLDRLEKLLPICVDGKWGYINLNGRIVVPCQYHYASTFSDGLAVITTHFDYEEYKNNEEMIVDEQFREIGRLRRASTYHRFFEGLLAFERDEKWGYVEKSAEIIIPPKFDSVGDFVDGLARATIDWKYGIIDRSGEWIIPPIYENIWPFKKDERVTAFETHVPVEIDWGTCVRVSKREYALMTTVYNNLRADGMSPEQARIDSGLHAICSALDSDSDFEALSWFEDYLNGKQPTKRAWGLVDRQGNIVTEPKFRSLGWPSKGVLAAGAQVDGEHKEGIINEHGEWLVEPRWDDTDGGFTDDLMSAAIDGKWGLVNRTGEWAVKPKYTNARKFSDDLCGVYVGGGRDLDGCLVDGKYGFINKDGDVVIEPRFDDVDDFEDGVCRVELIDGDPQDNLICYGYIDTYGRYIWEPTR